MNFLQRAALRFATGQKGVTWSTNFTTSTDDYRAWTPGWGGSQNQTTSATVAIVLQTLITNFNEPKITVKRRTDDEDLEITGHPLTKLLRRPNPYYLGRELQSAWMTNRGLNGNGYIRKVRGGNLAAPVELWSVPYWAVTPKLNRGLVTGYEVKTATSTTEFVPREDMVHLRWGANAKCPHLGVNPLEVLGAEIGVDVEASLYSYFALKNPAAGLLLTPERDVDLTPDQEANIKQKIEDSATGRQRHSVVAVNAPLKLEKFGYAPKDVAPDSMRMVPQSQIAAYYGVPAIVAGLAAGLERSTFSNVREAKEMFTENTLCPLWSDVAAQFDIDLLPEFNGLPVTFKDGKRGVADSNQDYVCYDLSGVRALQEDEDKRYARWGKLYVDGVAKRSDARAAVGLEVDKVADDVYANDVSQGVTGAAKSLYRSAKERANARLATIDKETEG